MFKVGDVYSFVLNDLRGEEKIYANAEVLEYDSDKALIKIKFDGISTAIINLVSPTFSRAL